MTDFHQSLNAAMTRQVQHVSPVRRGMTRQELMLEVARQRARAAAALAGLPFPEPTEPEAPLVGRHSDDLYREDYPSRNIAAAEPWWAPRHKASA